MPQLILTSLLWAFSFGLIKNTLSGVDAGALAVLRLALSLLVFLPFLRVRGIGRGPAAFLALIGLVQFGWMYALYLASFRYLAAYQVALFTLLTPFYVTWIHDLLSRRFHPRAFAASALAVLGALIVAFRGWGDQVPWEGFLLVQGSNLCFAFGQVFYARWMKERPDLRDRDLFALLYAGGVMGALGATCLTGGWKDVSLNATQWGVILYLGVVASGLGFFWWNQGAQKVGGGTLAVMNNLKVPLGVACALLVFGEKTDLVRLLVGGGLILFALMLNRREEPET